jgi:hypothetical protein
VQVRRLLCTVFARCCSFSCKSYLLNKLTN